MAKNMEFLDTNCLLRYVLGDNKEQADKVETLVAKGVHVNNGAFLEFVWVLESFYKMNRQQVLQKIRVFTEDKRVACNRELVARVSELYVKYPQISFLDAYLAVTAGKKGGKLRTFDKDLAKKLPSLVRLIS